MVVEWIELADTCITLALKIIRTATEIYKTYKTLTEGIPLALNALISAAAQARVFNLYIGLAVPDQEPIILDHTKRLQKTLQDANDYITKASEKKKFVPAFLKAKHVYNKLMEHCRKIEDARLQFSTTLVGRVLIDIGNLKDVVSTGLTKMGDMLQKVTDNQYTEAQARALTADGLKSIDDAQKEHAKKLDALSTAVQENTVLLQQIAVTVARPIDSYCASINTSALKPVGNITDKVKICEYCELPVVVKYYPETNDPDERDHIARAIEIASKISMSRLVQVYGIVRVPAQQQVGIVMEKQDGNLRDLLLKKDIELKWRKRASMAMEIAQGLRHLHKREMLHRNICTESILYDGDKHCKITGYGVAKRQDSPDSFIFTVKNTPAYRAPETYAGEYTVKSDIYSFGVVLWEICSRTPPGKGKNDTASRLLTLDKQNGFSTLCPMDGIPPEFVEIINGCCLFDGVFRTELSVAIQLLEELSHSFNEKQ